MPEPGVLLIDLPDERGVDSAKTVEGLSQPAADGRDRSQDHTAETAETELAVEEEETEGAAGRTEEGGEVSAVEETVEEMKEETVEEADEETVEEVDEETEEVEHKVEQRPPRIVKR
ncbi:hypothetical protein FJT64_005928 [Amphibalanus amphitrite]|uniref:Uncharacterized protein n=1 Tax=Amphibalanus amphitrite TaxID=1232801 RepID=A0A6A4VJQ9_AMPAM|nr:hypothetical protein FJT64_005928 [Amphibalanus amphitrite]